MGKNSIATILEKIGVQKAEIHQAFHSMPYYGSSQDRASDPNRWFYSNFTEAAKVYGPGFMQGETGQSLMNNRKTMVAINDDAWAASLAGNREIGLSLIYYPLESQFYYYEYRVEAYCPVTDEKVKLLVSNTFIRCSQECGGLVVIDPLVTEFRDEKVISAIVDKAKVILQVGSQFFKQGDAARRYIDGKYIEANESVSYEAFISRNIVREKNQTLTARDAYHFYFAFCHMEGFIPLPQVKFKEIFTDVVSNRWNLKPRKDILSLANKQQYGWKGIGCSNEDLRAIALN